MLLLVCSFHYYCCFSIYNDRSLSLSARNDGDELAYLLLPFRHLLCPFVVCKRPGRPHHHEVCGLAANIFLIVQETDPVGTNKEIFPILLL